MSEPYKIQFPTMLRKMWSGGEVQDWLDKLPELFIRDSRTAKTADKPEPSLESADGGVWLPDYTGHSDGAVYFGRGHGPSKVCQCESKETAEWVARILDDWSRKHQGRQLFLNAAMQERGT